MTKRETKKAGLTSDDLASAIKTLAQEKRLDRAGLESAGIRLPVIFLGDEPLRVKRTIAWLAEQLNLTGSSLRRFFGGELSGKAAIEGFGLEVASADMFSQARMVVLQDAHLIRAAQGDALLRALGAVSPQVVLVITMKSAEGKAGFLKELVKTGTPVSFAELTGPRLIKWMQAELERLSPGTRLAPPAAEILAGVYGSSLTNLSAELERLALLTKRSGTIDVELVREHIQSTPEQKSFDLFHDIARRDVLTSLARTKQLVEQGFHPIQVSTFLSRCYRTLSVIQAKAPRRTGAGAAESELSAELTNAWFERSLSGASRMFNEQDMLGGLERLLALDLSLKGYQIDEETSLLSAVQDLALRRSPHAATLEQLLSE